MPDDLSCDGKYMLAQIGKVANLPYGLDVWVSKKKVMNIEWADDGRVELISFKPGDWQQRLAAA
jgi:hypothetical protein